MPSQDENVKIDIESFYDYCWTQCENLARKLITTTKNKQLQKHQKLE